MMQRHQTLFNTLLCVLNVSFMNYDLYVGNQPNIHMLGS